MESITLKIPHQSYPILIQSGMFRDLGDYLEDLELEGKTAIVTNATIAPLYSQVFNAIHTQCSFDRTPGRRKVQKS